MLRATCDYRYDDTTYFEYLSMRDNARGLGVLLLIVGVLLVAIFAMLLVRGDVTAYGLGVAFAGVLSLVASAYCVVTGKVKDLGSRNGQVAGFLKKHGATDYSGFHEIVCIFDEGVQILYGPIGAPEEEMTHVEKKWSTWRDVKVSAYALLIVTRTTNDNAFRNMLGIDYLINQFGRDQHEDAYMPLSGLSGMSAQELATFVRGKLGK